LRHDQQRGPGRLAVVSKVTDPRFPQDRRPVRAFGQAAIYFDHFSQGGVMRKILLRMSDWMNGMGIFI
jgi:hypothetical protein